MARDSHAGTAGQAAGTEPERFRQTPSKRILITGPASPQRLQYKRKLREPQSGREGNYHRYTDRERYRNRNQFQSEPVRWRKEMLHTEHRKAHDGGNQREPRQVSPVADQFGVCGDMSLPICGLTRHKVVTIS